MTNKQCAKRVEELTQGLTIMQKDRIKQDFNRWAVVNKEKLNNEYFSTRKLQKLLTRKYFYIPVFVLIFIFDVLISTFVFDNITDAIVHGVCLGLIFLYGVALYCIRISKNRWLNEYRIKFYQNQIELLKQEGDKK